MGCVDVRRELELYVVFKTLTLVLVLTIAITCLHILMVTCRFCKKEKLKNCGYLIMTAYD